MTLSQLYEEAKKRPRPLAPAVSFVREVAEVTKRGEVAVYRWLNGTVIPDALTQDVLARHFNTTPDKLFPKVTSSK